MDSIDPVPRCYHPLWTINLYPHRLLLLRLSSATRDDTFYFRSIGSFRNRCDWHLDTEPMMWFVMAHCRHKLSGGQFVSELDNDKPVVIEAGGEVVRKRNKPQIRVFIRSLFAVLCRISILLVCKHLRD